MGLITPAFKITAKNKNKTVIIFSFYAITRQSNVSVAGVQGCQFILEFGCTAPRPLFYYDIPWGLELTIVTYFWFRTNPVTDH